MWSPFCKVRPYSCTKREPRNPAVLFFYNMPSVPPRTGCRRRRASTPGLLNQGSISAVVLFMAGGLVVLGGADFGAMKLGKKTSKGEFESRKAAANNEDDSFGVVSVGNRVGANGML